MINHCTCYEIKFSKFKCPLSVFHRWRWHGVFYLIWEKCSFCWTVHAVPDSQPGVSWRQSWVQPSRIVSFPWEKKPLRYLSYLLYGLPPVQKDLPQISGFLEVSNPGNWRCELSENVSLFLKAVGWWKRLPQTKAEVFQLKTPFSPARPPSLPGTCKPRWPFHQSHLGPLLKMPFLAPATESVSLSAHICIRNLHLKTVSPENSNACVCRRTPEDTRETEP